MRPIEDHLIDHARTIIKDFGPEWGRRILLGCVPVWRKEYGEAITGRVTKEIRLMLAGKK